MKLTIIFRDENREVECDNAEVEDGMLYVYKYTPEENGARIRKAVQIWNMSQIIGVEMEET